VYDRQAGVSDESSEHPVDDRFIIDRDYGES